MDSPAKKREAKIRVAARALVLGDSQMHQRLPKAFEGVAYYRLSHRRFTHYTFEQDGRTYRVFRDDAHLLRSEEMLK